MWKIRDEQDKCGHHFESIGCRFCLYTWRGKKWGNSLFTTFFLSTVLPPSPSLGSPSHSKQDMQQVRFLCSCCWSPVWWLNSATSLFSVAFTFQNRRLLMYVMSIKWKYLGWCYTPYFLMLINLPGKELLTSAVPCCWSRQGILAWLFYVLAGCSQWLRYPVLTLNSFLT